MLYICSSSASVRKSPHLSGDPIAILYRGHVVHNTGNIFVQETSNFGHVEFTEIIYKDSRAWIYSNLLDKYIDESSFVVTIPDEIKTKSDEDAEQYIIYEGAKKTNLCGEFCAAYLGNDDIVSFLQKWKLKFPANYKAGVIENKPMGIASLKTMLDVYPLEHINLIKLFDDKVVGAFYSIKGFASALKDGWKAILGVKIGYDGKINTGTTGHWVALKSIEQIRNGDGIVVIYNPFSNRMQKYSYAELIKSMGLFGGFSGLWVKPNE